MIHAFEADVYREIVVARYTDCLRQVPYTLASHDRGVAHDNVLVAKVTKCSTCQRSKHEEREGAPAVNATLILSSLFILVYGYLPTALDLSETDTPVRTERFLSPR